jgi:hypothetical protein
MASIQFKFMSTVVDLNLTLQALPSFWIIAAADLLDRGSFDQNSLDRNCVLSLDRNFDNQLTKFLDAFQLIETFNNDFGQTPKFKAFDRIIRSTA